MRERQPRSPIIDLSQQPSADRSLSGDFHACQLTVAYCIGCEYATVCMCVAVLAAVTARDLGFCGAGRGCWRLRPGSWLAQRDVRAWLPGLRRCAGGGCEAINLPPMPAPWGRRGETACTRA